MYLHVLVVDSYFVFELPGAMPKPYSTHHDDFPLLYLKGVGHDDRVPKAVLGGVPFGFSAVEETDNEFVGIEGEGCLRPREFPLYSDWELSVLQTN